MDLKLIYKITFIVSTLASSSLSQATELTWQESVSLVQKNNPQLISSAKDFDSVKALENTSYAGFLPKLSASLGENQSAGDSFAFTRSYSAQINLTQNIFSGFADLNRKSLNAANTDVAWSTLQIALAEVSSELKQAYESVLFAQSFKKLTSDIINRRKENLKNVQLRFQSGRENKGSVLLSESYVEQAIYDELSAAHQESTSKESLKRILGLSQSEEIVLRENDSAFLVSQSIDNPNFQKLAGENPSYLSAQAQVQTSHYSYEISKAQFLPSLDLVGSYGKYDSVFFPDQKKWNVGLTLSIPLFDGAKDYFASKANYLKYESSDIVAKDKFHQISLNLKSAYYDYLESVQKEKVDESFNKAALVRAEIARSKYKNGLMSFDDWDLVENDLIQRQKSLLTSKKDRVFKFASWEQIQGVGVFNEKK